MPSALASISRRLSSARPANCRHFGWVLVVGLHLAALAILIWSEIDLTSRLAFLLAWGLVNFVWLMVLRRPAATAALSLTLVVLLILLSRFKHDILMMTVNFLDIMIVDIDSVAFLLTVFPNLKWVVLATALLALPAFGLLWWSDPCRVRLRAFVLGAAGCFAGLSAVALTVPNDLYEEFYSANYVSKFARSGVTGLVDLYTRGYLEADATAAERLAPPAGNCRPVWRLPHIVMGCSGGAEARRFNRLLIDAGLIKRL